MPLLNLEHFLIQTADLDATRDWYVNVLGLRVGDAPEFHFRVCWLYLGDTAVLHIAEGGADVSDNRLAYLGQQSTETHGSGAIDHLAFHASGLREMLAHFDGLGVEYTTREIDDNGLFQMFLNDPNGIKVELNFTAKDAEGVVAQVSTADLT